jgi:L-alanine-DL-glutamate epimerase-like enolase superfamily enzyme
MKREVPGYYYGEPELGHFHGALDRGVLTEFGLAHTIDCVAAMKEVLGDRVGLALDCGPGWMLSDAIRFARAVEPYHLMWIEDMLTGDYIPYVHADMYRDLTLSTSTPIHTGEQIYLRQNFKDLIEKKAVRVIGPDPCDVGGIAELKWIAEYADLHGRADGAHTAPPTDTGPGRARSVCATLPHNFIAFRISRGERPLVARHRRGPPIPIVKNGMIEVWDRPGMGLELIPERARAYLAEDDGAFFN